MVPGFNFESLLQASIAHEATAFADPHIDLFGLSPLSSPDTSPLQSPLPSATSTPGQSPQIPILPLPVYNPTPILHPASAVSKPAKESMARKSCKKEKGHLNHSKNHHKQWSEGFATVDTRKAVINKHVKGNVPILSQMSMEEAGVTWTAYIRLDDHTHSQKIYWLKELTGFKLVEWDGR